MSELGQLSGFSFPRTRRPWVFRFKLSFVPWTRCPDITLSAGPNVFQRLPPLLIELNVRGCSVIQLSSCSFSSAASALFPASLANFYNLSQKKTKVKHKNHLFLPFFMPQKSPVTYTVGSFSGLWPKEVLSVRADRLQRINDRGNS